MLIGHEVSRTGCPFLVLEHKGREHAEDGSADKVDLQVVEVGMKGKVGLSDFFGGSVPEEGVVDHASIGIDC